MEFLSAVALRFPLTNNQLRTYSNPGNQETIQDGLGRNNVTGQGKVIKCYNCQEENGQVLDEEQLAFLADLGLPNGEAAQTRIP
nr:hypothetical protein [Tanacetum cinerariifolium]